MDKPININILSIKKISPALPHNAFTDLIRIKNTLWLCFRTAVDHHSSTSKVVVISLNTKGEELSRCYISLPHSDLRDPRLLQMNNHLYLTAYSREKKNTTLQSRNTFFEYQGGITWEHRGYFGAEFQWCWRFTLHNNRLYSIAYERSKEHLLLYKGKSLSALRAKPKAILSKQKHGFGYPNESDLFFTTKQAHAIVRRDADSFTTLLGISTAPFTDWVWHELKVYMASPVIIGKYKDYLLIAARYEHSSDNHENAISSPFWKMEAEASRVIVSEIPLSDISYKDGDLKTGIFSVSLKSLEQRLLCALPSTGDNGYPGASLEGNTLWLSYYSSDGASDGASANDDTDVYLCKLSLAF
ncbi:hypothetical protein ISG33_02850 [Glaciecola sp. MH2013]|uniref:hypothetical protein n=1 Tax=Glaciecola sp. MH2013 TaxID=2785524 RepID=UPI00189DD659|nr:hypothetical protein [Glaciecola sp. MH2013]MBF7072341.1 hypothetical protein [Glaciecola sp. MH2013]